MKGNHPIPQSVIDECNKIRNPDTLNKDKDIRGEFKNLVETINNDEELKKKYDKLTETEEEEKILGTSQWICLACHSSICAQMQLAAKNCRKEREKKGKISAQRKNMW